MSAPQPPQPGQPFTPPGAPAAYPPAQPGYGPAQQAPGYAQPGYPQQGYAQPGYAQPAYAQPGHPQPAYGQPVHSAIQQGVQIDTKFIPINWFFYFIKPKIEVDGYPVNAQWGINEIPLPPGQHQVHVHVPYFLPPKVGPATTVVNVGQQQVVPVEYRAPVWAFSEGSIGPAPQSYNGVGITLGMILVPIVLFLLLMILIVATA
ncbi:hypothetical protein [Gordonia sp. X0973]|uniref:hypothetical protein n=1 Tax=Gordonia sp. X0973 TaxID=2742602 RepID=UPI0026573586|nr:hypothetical protein [Gordonia sp. X0973]